MKLNWKSIGKAYGRGIHALIALMLAGFCAQLATMALAVPLSWLFFGADPAREGIVGVICYLVIGLPVFGALFSRAYSPAEPSRDVR